MPAYSPEMVFVINTVDGGGNRVEGALRLKSAGNSEAGQKGTLVKAIAKRLARPEDQFGLEDGKGLVSDVSSNLTQKRFSASDGSQGPTALVTENLNFALPLHIGYPSE
jgi:hypothetical protein